MKKLNRLLTPQEFQRVFKQGKKQKGELFTFICSPNKLSCARLGLAIAKRVIPLAVNRNRIRRLIRESFRQHLDGLAGLDIVVMTGHVSPPAYDRKTFEDLNQQWQKLVTYRSTS